MPAGGGERWFAQAVRAVPAGTRGALTGLLLLLALLGSIPAELRRRLLLEIRAGWFEVTETVHMLVVPLLGGDRGGSCRLLLPSLFWRTVSMVAMAAVLGSDPSVQRLWTEEASCNIPSNASREDTRITTFSYDADGRLEQVNTPEGVINYEYDPATGRHIRTCTANSEVEYGYDPLGRLATVTVTVVKRNGVELAPAE